MNKKYTILIILSLLTIGILCYSFYLSSLHKISFETKGSFSTIDIYKRHSSEKISTINLQKKEVLSLPNDNYYAVLPDSAYNQTPVYFTVDNKDLTVSINPDYSDEHLETLLKTEQSAIYNVIDKYLNSENTQDYIIKKGALFEKGDWFGGVLVNKKADNNNPKDTYRVILKKDNESWSMATTPMIIFSSAALPDIPIEVLRKVNALHADD